MKIRRSKTGKPVIAESGGGMSNTGSSTIVCGPLGQPLKPLFIPKGYSNGEHALFVVGPGMHVISASRDRSGEYVTVRQILAIGIDSAPDELEVEVVAEHQNGDGNIPSELQAAVDAAIEKAFCYHCREPHYVAS